MEVVAFVGVVIALAEAVKKAIDFGESTFGSKGKVAANRNEAKQISVDILLMLESIKNLVGKRMANEPGMPELAKDLREYEKVLKEVLSQCSQMNTPKSGFALFMKNFDDWREMDEIREKLTSLEKRVERSYKRLQLTLSIRNDLRGAEIKETVIGVSDSVAEVNTGMIAISQQQQRGLAHIQSQLEKLVVGAVADSDRAHALVGVRKMNVRQASVRLEEAEKDLQDEPHSEIEKIYLRVKIKTLKNVISNSTLATVPEDIPAQIDDRKPFTSNTHYSNSGSPDKEMQDSVVETIRIVDMFQSGEDIPFVRAAQALLNLSVTLGDIGMNEDSLSMNEWSLEIYRLLAKDRPEVFGTCIAAALGNLCVQLDALGLQERALQSGKESVDLYRQLAIERPDLYKTDLARTLTSISGRLEKLGYRDDAVEAAREALVLNQQLFADHPDEFKPGLADSLNTLSNRLDTVGRREEALEKVKESMILHRQLAEERPETFRPRLAGALNNFADRLKYFGHWEEARPAAEESVSIFRQLARHRPDVWLPHLGNSSLITLSEILLSSGNVEKAKEPITEAVSILTSLVRKTPRKHSCDLHFALAMESTVLSRLSDTDGAANAQRKMDKVESTMTLVELARAARELCEICREPLFPKCSPFACPHQKVDTTISS